jgi:hypothetical protein
MRLFHPKPDGQQARATKERDSVNSIDPAEACSDSRMAGNAGRYMSIDSGATAVRQPSSTSQRG